MSALWQPPAGMRIAPGYLGWHVMAVCDRCDHEGTSGERERAQAEAEAHVCDPRAVERTKARWDVQRRAVVAVPSEGGDVVYAERRPGARR